jgi:hypothetical protein
MSQITPVILCGGSGIRPGKAAFAAVLGEFIGYAPWPHGPLRHGIWAKKMAALDSCPESLKNRQENELTH